MTEIRKPTYRLKHGYGKDTRRIDGVRTKIVPGQKISCWPEELGSAIDKYEIVQEGTPFHEEVPAVGLVVTPREDGAFDVFNNQSGARLNDMPLTEDEAKQMAAVFSADEPAGGTTEPPPAEPPTTDDENAAQLGDFTIIERHTSFDDGQPHCDVLRGNNLADVNSEPLTREQADELILSLTAGDDGETGS